ncbi:hypothetical protein BS50DRAFT_621481 [Corynespora cassiicola Philippines]|uniref:Calcineurin-like phosphoesterase domain-containing protein n=1 Tax=Corynespora cassiicola Philippines TaxID=1448308 RepID=A0A2T2NQ03_CORCC|nr:hypothetical protein BS50DRAFT_621481 [Corynespora cassiicola Philippines]
MVFPTLTGRPSPPPDPFEPLPLPSLLLRAPVKLLLSKLYALLSALRSTPTPHDPPIRIVCLSDTHTHTLCPGDVPLGDVLVHAGDLSDRGSVAEIQAQVDWLAGLPHREVVVVAGNHDRWLDPRTRGGLAEGREGREAKVEWGRVHYLQHRRVSLSIPVGEARTWQRQDAADSPQTPEPEPEPEPEPTSRTHLLARRTTSRRIRIYGAPQIPACGPMSEHAFQYPRGRDAWSETVPDDVDVLVTHTPPKFHLDLPLPDGLGCEHLMREVRRVKPALHVFGHVHWGAGKATVWWDGAHDAYETAMGVRSKWTRGLLNPWLWWNVVRVGYRGLRELIWDKIWGGQGPNTIMVNAAQMHGNTGKLGNRVQVVDI